MSNYYVNNSSYNRNRSIDSKKMSNSADEEAADNMAGVNLYSVFVNNKPDGEGSNETKSTRNKSSSPLSEVDVSCSDLNATAHQNPQQQSDKYWLRRPAWFDAEAALHKIEKGRAIGNKTTLWFRAGLQGKFYQLGRKINHHAIKTVITSILIMLLFCTGTKSIVYEADIDRLWVEEGGRVEKEMLYTLRTLGKGTGTTTQEVIQSVRSPNGTLLTSEALLFHLRALTVALDTTVSLQDMEWKLKDICYKPSGPAFEEHHIDTMLDNLIPCQIMTPLDCFWEGSKLLGPEVPVNIPGMGLDVKWTNLNPDLITKLMAEAMMSENKNMTYDNIYRKSSLTVLESVSKFMKDAGITTGYQKKPCLNPKDPDCPLTAPNKGAAHVRDIGAVLTGGCYGFASNSMHYPEDIIIGGVEKNKSGIITKATALQSSVLLMGEQQLYEFYANTYKTHHVDWTLDKARQVLDTWKSLFTDRLEMYMELEHKENPVARRYSVTSFTDTTLKDIMSYFSRLNPINITIAYSVLIFIFLCRYFRWDRSRWDITRLMIIIFFFAYLAMAVWAGLGACALFGLSFNALTAQILPFIILGYIHHSMNMVLDTMRSKYVRDQDELDQVAEGLKQTGGWLILEELCMLIAFGGASIIPIPALRYFVLQVVVLSVFILYSVIAVMHAFLAIEIRVSIIQTYPELLPPSYPSSRYYLLNFFYHIIFFSTSKWVGIKKLDFRAGTRLPTEQPICGNLRQHPNYAYSHCMTRIPLSTFGQKPITQQQQQQQQQPSKNSQPSYCKCVDSATTVDAGGDNNELIRWCLKCGGDKRMQAEGESIDIFCERGIEKDGDFAAAIDDLKKTNQQSQIKSTKIPKLKNIFVFSVNKFVQKIYLPLIECKLVSWSAVLFLIALIVVSIMGARRVQDGLKLTDLVPRDTVEHQFLVDRKKYFNGYNILAVTKGNFDYPNNQRLLSDYHKAFTSVESIKKNDDGGMPDFWLIKFCTWLTGLQEAFDRDLKNGCITRETWHANASSEAILAYKLLVQTGKVDNPVDKSLVLTTRLVDDQCIINPKPFYNYLTAWVTNDPLMYGQSQAELRPEPRNWLHDPKDVELKIPKSQPLIYAQVPFLLTNVETTSKMVAAMNEIREICRKFEALGLPNYPTGIPFTFWEQYVNLFFYQILAHLIVYAGIFLVITIFFLNLWSGALVVGQLMCMSLQLYGSLGWFNLQFNAIPAAIIVFSNGIWACNLTLMLVSFQTSIGDRRQRMSLALEHMFTSIFFGVVSYCIAFGMLIFSEFGFIVNQFFYILAISMLISFVNTIYIFPVVLGICGPSAEVVPLNDEDCISLPSYTPQLMMGNWIGNPIETRLEANNKNLSRSSNSLYSSTNSIYSSNASIASTLSSASTKSTPSGKYYRGMFDIYKRHPRKHKRKNFWFPHAVDHLSDISEESSLYQNSEIDYTPPGKDGKSSPHVTHSNMPSNAPTASHEIVVQPEFVVETTITNNPLNVCRANSTASLRTSSCTPEDGNRSSNESPSNVSTPSPECDRDSPAGCSERSFSGSHVCSNNGVTTTTTSQDPQSTTVTTKVMATTKLTLPTPPALSTIYSPAFMAPPMYGHPGAGAPAPGNNVGPSPMFNYYPYAAAPNVYPQDSRWSHSFIHPNMIFTVPPQSQQSHQPPSSATPVVNNGSSSGHRNSRSRR